MTPGPALSAVLDGIDLSRLCGYDCVQVMQARYRQLNHERARLMATMVEVGLCDIGPDDELPRRAAPDEFAADEIRAALVFTRRAAEAQFWLAYDLVTRLPAVHAALDAGLIDEPRARIFSEWTAELSGEQARVLCDTLLPRAIELTTGELVDVIKKHAIALDPDWARHRYEQALADRKVVGRRNPDGSANLSGCNLPVDRVAAASAHIDALAKAAKHAGDTRPIDHIRADLFLGMTDGTYTGLDDTTILTLLRTAAATQCPAAANTQGEGGDGPAGEDPPGDGPPDEGGGDGGGGHGGGDDDPPGPDSGPTAGGRARHAGIELRVRLSTVLGRDDHPGEIAGWGPVHAGLARDLAATMTRAQWRFAITDNEGQLVSCGISRARPTPTGRRPARATSGTERGAGGTGGIVELQVPAELLRALAADLAGLGDWAHLVTDLAAQHTKHATGSYPFTADETRRMPGAGLRRHLEIRDRFCVFQGCGTPAHATDIDHTVDHSYGGLTLEHNLGGACRHDHRLKHDGGWRLTQPQPGLFRWISRLGHTYTVRPPPIIEQLPDPLPRDGPDYPIWIRPDDGWRDSTILHDPPPDPPF